MNRREALAAVSVLFGGAIIGSEAFLAGCASPRRPEPGFVGLLSDSDVALLDEVADTILPTTASSPGAKAANVGAFMNVMVTDCYSPTEQQIFRDGLVVLNAAATDGYGKGFVNLSPEDRHAFLLTLEGEADGYRETRTPEDPEIHYYRMIKQLSVWGYFTSEIGSTQALRWIPVPGRYDGCVPLEEGQKAWA